MKTLNSKKNLDNIKDRYNGLKFVISIQATKI